MKCSEEVQTIATTIGYFFLDRRLTEGNTITESYQKTKDDLHYIGITNIFVSEPNAAGIIEILISCHHPALLIGKSGIFVRDLASIIGKKFKRLVKLVVAEDDLNTFLYPSDYTQGSMFPKL